MRSADRVVSALLPLQEHLRAADLLPSKTPVDFIPNGYDPADFEGVDAGSLRSPDKFLIVYTGSFYGERQTPEYFLRGLRDFLAQNADRRSRVEVRIVGSIFDRHSRLIDELDLGDVVKIWGTVSHDVAVRHQLAADLLLLVIGKGPGSDMVLTGKVFEYIGASRPILALVPPNGAAAKLIDETKTGVIVDPLDVNEISRTLAMLYDAWAAGGIQFGPDDNKIRQYDRRMLTGNLAETFEHAIQAASTRLRT